MVNNDDDHHDHVNGTIDSKQVPTTSTTTISSSGMPPLPIPPTLKFGPFNVSSQIFHISPSRLSYGLVNLKPLLPGHILICPLRSVPRLSQLSVSETTDLFATVRRVSFTLERLYSASGFNVAVQDGLDAGQSVPHVHVHVIPRKAKDMDARGGGDAVYDLMDGEEGDLGQAMVEMLRKRQKRNREEQKEFGGEDKERKERGEEEMKKEAEWLEEEMGRDEADASRSLE